MNKLLILALGCLFISSVLAQEKKNNEAKALSLAELMNVFKNSYSANRGKRSAEEVDMEDIEGDDELSDEDLEELAFRGFYNPTGFFFKPGKRGNPNSMLLMAGKRGNPNSMLLMAGKRGNPNSMLLMPGKRFGNPNSMLLMPAGKRDLLLPRPNGLILGKRNPNSVFLGPLYRRAEEKRETDLDEFFTSRGKKSVLYVPKPESRGYSAKATFSAARG